MLWVARGSRRGRCWSYVIGQHPDLPNIALTSINRKKIALVLKRLAVRRFNSFTPFSICRYFISRTYNTKRIRVMLAGMVAGMRSLEPLSVLLFDGLAAVNRSCVRHKNSVLREERGHGGSIIVVACLVKLLRNRVKLFDYLWIDLFFLL